MLDIRFIRENPELVRENIRKKFQDKKLPLVDEVLELDEKLRAAKTEANELRANRNALSKKIGMLMGQAKKDPSKLEEAEDVKAEVAREAARLAELEKLEPEYEAELTKRMMVIPQMIDPSVPIGPDDSCNVEVQRFGEATVPDFEIPYHIDIMELCQDYFNGDISFEGKAYLNDIKNFKYSSSMDISGERSFTQKKLSIISDMDVLTLNVGEMDFYMNPNTVYFMVPMLDNLSYAMTTGNTYFKKAPELTHDIDQEWFHDNFSNIIELTRQIQIEETGKTRTDSDDVKSHEYLVTIPEGSGDFIWELLGMDAPDYDIRISLYLTGLCRMSRMEVDLSDITKGASMIIDGTDAGTCILSYEMPNGERLTLTYVRNPSVTHVNFIYMDCLYETNQGDNFTASGYITTQPDDNGCQINVKNLSVMQGDELLGTFSFIGTITKEKNLPDVFRDASLDSPDMEHIDWQTVRNDTEGFIQDVIDEAKKRLTE